MAGCATTARQQRATAGDNTSQVFVGPGTREDAPAAEDPAAPDGNARVAEGGARATGPSDRPRSVGGAPTAVAGRRTSGTVKIGFGYPSNLSSAYAAFGGNNLTGDDWRVYIEPLVAWVNAHGGLGGRAIEAVYHATDPTNGTFQTQAERACAAFTQDAKVFAVIGTVLAENEVDCLAKANTPFLAQSAALFDRTMFERYPGLVFQPFMITAERQGVWLDSLFSQGYFSKGAKVGLLQFDNSTYRNFAEKVIKPRLSARGVEVADEVSFAVPDSAAAAGGLFAQANNAVLRFKSANITHVILSPSGGTIPFVFMQPAESQSYRPRYALNSLEVPAFVTQNVPVEQLRGSVGVGWLPSSDLYYEEVVHGTNAAEDLCFEITKRNGDEVKRYCDGLFFLKAALDRTTELSPAALRAAVEALGTSYQSPWTGATRFGPGRYDGARQVRPLAFVPDCQCYRYTGGQIEVP